MSIPISITKSKEVMLAANAPNAASKLCISIGEQTTAYIRQNFTAGAILMVEIAEIMNYGETVTARVIFHEGVQDE